MAVTTSKVKVPAMVIPKGSVFAYETPEMCPKAHAVVLAVAKRGGGKTVACTTLMLMMKFDRIFAISPSMKSNLEMMNMLKIDPEDVYEDPDDLASSDKVKAAMEAERDDLERYLEELKRYNKLMKAIHSSDNLFRIPDDELSDFYVNGDFVPPKHTWGGKAPMCALLLDDCMGSMLYSKPRRLNQFTIYHRHIGQFEKGGAVGCSMFFLIQSFKSQVGGLTKTIRNQTTCLLFFKSQSEKELDDVAESVSGEVLKEVFERVYNLAIREPHDFLFIDLHRKKSHPSMFRRNFDEFLIVGTSRFFLCVCIIGSTRKRPMEATKAAPVAPLETPAPRPKAPRSEAQRAQFELARQRAYQMRKDAVIAKKAASAKRTLEETDALALQAVRKADAAQAAAGPSEPEPAAEESPPEPERVKVSAKAEAKEAAEPATKPRKPPRRRVVVVEESSEDDDSDRTEEEIEVHVPRARKQRQAPAAPPPKPRAYSQMFELN